MIWHGINKRNITLNVKQYTVFEMLTGGTKKRLSKEGVSAACWIDRSRTRSIVVWIYIGQLRCLRVMETPGFALFHICVSEFQYLCQIFIFICNHCQRGTCKYARCCRRFHSITGVASKTIHMSHHTSGLGIRQRVETNHIHK